MMILLFNLLLTSIACLYSDDPPPKQYEMAFKQRAATFREQSLAYCDRLPDFLICTTLLARHSLARGNTRRGVLLSQGGKEQ